MSFLLKCASLKILSDNEQLSFAPKITLMIGQFEIIKFWERNKKRRASHKIAPPLLNVSVLVPRVRKNKETDGTLKSCYHFFKLEKLFGTEF